MKKLLLATAVVALGFGACSNPNQSESETEAETAVTTDVMPVADAPAIDTAVAAEIPVLSDILAAQPDEVKARYSQRHPQETLEFFGIAPGMTVAEVLPGGGWYTKLLLPYLGSDGHLVGVDYDVDMWAKFGGFADEKFLADRKNWAEKWTNDAMAWRAGAETRLSGFAFGSAPSDMDGTIDAVLMIRALHHLNRFEQAHLAAALADVKKILKPDGIVGIVQHRAAEDQDDGWAEGDNGYMKQSLVIQIMNDAGFELVGEPSEINANPKDKAMSANNDKVWRLPPTLGTSANDPELRAKMKAIGETDRMTLKFKKK